MTKLPEKPGTAKKPEPTFLNSLGRVGRESLQIVFFVGMHWLVRWSIQKTGQGEAWWAWTLENGTALYAVVVILVIGGLELVTGIALAFKDAKHRLGIGQ